MDQARGKENLRQGGGENIHLCTLVVEMLRAETDM